MSQIDLFSEQVIDGQIFRIPQVALEQFGEIISCHHLLDDKIKKPLPWKGELYVATGGAFQKGCLYVEAIRLYELQTYKGQVYSCTQRCQSVVRGYGFYVGMRAKHRGKEYVLNSPQIRFEPC